MANTKVSIICSAHNREKYIHKCVDSILNQTIKSIELILIDNGSSDSTPHIVDEYAKKDKRVVAIHNPKGTTYGKALNQGISLAKGDYVAIVESDDFIVPEMYEKMYNRIKKFKAQACLCSFARITEDEVITPDCRILEGTQDVFDISTNPKMLYLHPSIWAKLCEASFVKKIKFIENDRFCDGPWLIDFCKEATVITGVNEPLYMYRQNNSEASTKKVNDIMCFSQTMMNILNKSKKNGLYDTYKEEIIYHMTYVSQAYLRTMPKKEQIKFAKEIHNVYQYVFKDNDFKYKYFGEFHKNFLNLIKHKKWKYLYTTFYKEKKFFGLFKKVIISNGRCTKHKILGITYKKSYFENETKITIIGRILKICKHDLYTKIYLGKFLIAEDVNYEKMIIRQDISNIITNRDWLYRVLAVYSLHQKVFPKYRGINKDKDVFICAAGPTFKEYNVQKTGVYIGVNNVYSRSDVQFDYLFASDIKSIRNNIEKILNYRGKDCCKFLGLPTQSVDWQIPADYLNRPNIENYYVEAVKTLIDTSQEVFPFDLTTQPLPCFGSITFASLAFALWTHPKRIFLVGCDATFNGHFDGSPMLSKNQTWTDFYAKLNMKGWIKFKEFVAKFYPDVEIVSVNPVRLKGMFKDVYTYDYVKNHIEISSENVVLFETYIKNVIGEKNEKFKNSHSTKNKFRKN